MTVGTVLFATLLVGVVGLLDGRVAAAAAADQHDPEAGFSQLWSRLLDASLEPADDEPDQEDPIPELEILPVPALRPMLLQAVALASLLLSVGGVAVTWALPLVAWHQLRTLAQMAYAFVTMAMSAIVAGAIYKRCPRRGHFAWASLAVLVGVGFCFDLTTIVSLLRQGLGDGVGFRWAQLSNWFGRLLALMMEVTAAMAALEALGVLAHH